MASQPSKLYVTRIWLSVTFSAVIGFVLLVVGGLVGAYFDARIGSDAGELWMIVGGAASGLVGFAVSLWKLYPRT